MAGSFYEMKRRARRQLHDAMSVPAFYFADPKDKTSWVLVSVRVHYKFDPLGDMKGTNLEYAERQEVIPRLIFDNNEITPRNPAVVSVRHNEAYQVDNTLPPDDFTTTAEAPRMPANLAALYPHPPEA